MGALFEWTRDVLSNFVVIGTQYSEWKSINRVHGCMDEQKTSSQRDSEQTIGYSWNFLPDGSLDVSHFISEYEKTHVTEKNSQLSNIEGTKSEQLLSSLKKDLISNQEPLGDGYIDLESSDNEFHVAHESSIDNSDLENSSTVYPSCNATREDIYPNISYEESDVLTMEDVKEIDLVNIPKSLIEKYSSSTIEESYNGEHIWVCQIVGKHDCYLHISDGLTKVWVKFGSEQSRETVTGDIVIIKIQISGREKKVSALGLITESGVTDIS